MTAIETLTQLLDTTVEMNEIISIYHPEDDLPEAFSWYLTYVQSFDTFLQIPHTNWFAVLQNLLAKAHLEWTNELPVKEFKELLPKLITARNHIAALQGATLQ